MFFQNNFERQHSSKCFRSESAHSSKIERGETLNIQQANGNQVDYFGQKKEQLLSRHPLNNRFQESVLNAYEQGILEHGIVDGVRGTPWLQQVKGNHQRFHLITNGTVTMALYRAQAKEPENAQVVASVDAGLRGCIILHADMPSDVVVFLRDLHNSWHFGSGTSLVDILSEVSNVEKHWLAYREANGISAREGTGENSYEKVYWRYVRENHPNVVKTWMQYDSSKSFLHAMQKKKVWDKFKAFCSNYIDFLHPSTNAESQITSVHTLLVALDKNFKHTIPSEGLISDRYCYFPHTCLKH